MNEFMKILLSLSVSGTLLLLLMLGLKQLYKNKSSRRWQYYIWLIVVLRFLLPFTPGTMNAGSLFEMLHTATVTDKSPAGPNVPVTADADDNKTTTKQPKDYRWAADTVTVNADDKAKWVQTQAGGNVAAATAAHHSLNVYACLFCVWSALALVLFVRKITIYQGFIRYIKAGNTEVSDIQALNLLSDCEEKLNIKTRVELYHNALIASPIMIGFFQPGIILPAGELEEEKLPYIFAHELLHYKRRDMFYKWLVQVVICIHWFNPFVYLLEKEVNRACELSCDEAVISMLDDKARREYGDTLLSFFRPDNFHKGSLASVTLTEGAEQLKERLGAIMNFKKKSKTVIAFTAIFTAVAVFCFLAAGAYAAPSANDNGAVWKNNETGKDNEIGKDKKIQKDNKIQNEVLTEDGVCYIFCDGAGENDKPKSFVSDGSVQFVLVRKNGYTSIGPFDNPETLMEDVTKQCEYMKSLTWEEKELVMETAAEVYGNLEYSASYEKNRKTDAYPYDEDLEKDRKTDVYLYDGDLDSGWHEAVSSQTVRYYEADSLPLFEIAFSRLDGEAQRKWLEKLYANNDFAFFSAAVRGLDSDGTLIAEFAQKAYADGETAFFSMGSGSCRCANGWRQACAGMGKKLLMGRMTPLHGFTMQYAGEGKIIGICICSFWS